MSDRITAWFELPSNMECKEDVICKRIWETNPKLISYSQGYWHFIGGGLCTHIVDEGLPGYAGIFIWDSSGIIYEPSKESTQIRRFIKEICNVFGTNEVWYSSELGEDYLEKFADPYIDLEFDWKSVVQKTSAELKDLYEKQRKGEDVTWFADKIFHHDDFWDL
ncbi:MAG: hypothetical protein IK005_12880 [Paludibacteraceae bacterium]|nr:hypothetical protein [Paludibacteraceae bacterium]